ncbi:phenazine biosynthesis protein PhzF family [Pseudonocardia dioxanivorans CB1190]|jgi:trans-2,3-dihydro-3-hydroxyanthranilate isomerase|uniref:Phenazine biosynthesis protein PhzF family n=1 Tax=Pseudonocardia dioxanivorans (strain ATCC 55486 / DSM 44775 / JCM 13855 / CB1190) TaxID=675635 RepID=F4CP30_PSEUX|nr:PhzF family phenazine biosynthesis protein [Pseudonocardia dioxanivorans]AEA23296.1 phenazine biosynthesis protein PhzF family [Pseudonocardia dioxanivorans CB1190]
MNGMRYDVVDVFTDRPFAGNPLAVVHGAGEAGLGGPAMQAIAAEFALSETVFVLPPTRQGADYRVRIFTPAVELPFAGHPSVGAAWVLARDGVIGGGDVVQECGAGLLPVHVDAAGARVTGGTPEVLDGVDPAGAVALAEAVGLTAADVDDRVPAGSTAAGVPYVVLPVRSDAVARAECDAGAVRALTAGRTGLVVAALEHLPEVHLRMFAPGSGVVEDPATGSAAVALGVFLADRGLLAAEGGSSFTIAQGAEIGRPSRLDVTVTTRAGAAVATTVRGGVAPVATGVLTARPAE